MLAAFAPQPEVMLLRVTAPLVTRAARLGQFVMVRVRDGWDPVLREPVLCAGVEPEAGVITLWVPAGSAGRERLRSFPAGAPVDLLGPLGRALPLRPEVRQVLLVAEGLALGPLLMVADVSGAQATLLVVAPEGGEFYPAEALPAALEYQRALGGAGAMVPRELLTWAEAIYAAGSQLFYQGLRDQILRERPGQRGGFAFGLLLEPFGWEPGGWREARAGCAVGACRSCLVELRREKRLACMQGPAFDLWAL
ncbi:MAG TPA: hypothetical protein VEQ85_10935 [Lacipirellulaceae bacterium]|nr:hypothetical protein [Lacipirellulaceae bacterium]